MNTITPWLSYDIPPLKTNAYSSENNNNATSSSLSYKSPSTLEKCLYFWLKHPKKSTLCVQYTLSIDFIRSIFFPLIGSYLCSKYHFFSTYTIHFFPLIGSYSCSRYHQTCPSLYNVSVRFKYFLIWLHTSSCWLMALLFFLSAKWLY